MPLKHHDFTAIWHQIGAKGRAAPIPCGAPFQAHLDFAKLPLSLQFNFGRDAETVRRIPTGEPRTHYVEASMPLSSVPGSVWLGQRDSLSDVQASVREVLGLWLGFLLSAAVTKMLVRPGTV